MNTCPSCKSPERQSGLCPDAWHSSRFNQMKIKKLTQTAIVPSRGTPHAAGWDLFVDPAFPTASWVRPGAYIKASTGIALQIPEGYFGLVKPRSSCFKQMLDISGVVDSDYRGDVFICIQNNGMEPFLIEPGKSYAQLILVSHNAHIEAEEVKELTTTNRGEKGFGSTGNI